MINILEKNRHTIMAVVFVAAILLVFYIFKIPCLIRLIFGVPCPGCGLSRAWESALHLDFEAAFRWHPLFLLVPVIFLLMTDILRNYNKTRLFAVVALAVAFIAVYAYRMIALFPDQEPMTYYAGSLIGRLEF